MTISEAVTDHPEAGAPEAEIEITPAMIEAALSVLAAYDTTFERDDVWAKRIYSAMEAARLVNKHLDDSE